MNSKDRIRVITDGAIITAIYAIFLLASRFIGGLLENWLYFILPIPISIYGYKYDLKGSLVVALSTIAISFLCVANPLSALFYVAPGVILGMFFPMLLKKKVNILVEVIYASSISLIVNVLTMVLFGFLFNYNIVDDTLLMVDEIMNLCEQFGINLYSRAMLEALFTSLIPASLIITAIMEGLLVDLATNLLLVRLKLKEKMELRNMLSIEHIHPVVGYIYIFIFVWMLIALNNIMTDIRWLFIIYAIIINIGIIYSFFMIYQGLFYIGKKARYTNQKGLYILAVFSVFFFPFIVIGFGVAQNIAHLSLRIGTNIDSNNGNQDN